MSYAGCVFERLDRKVVRTSGFGAPLFFVSFTHILVSPTILPQIYSSQAFNPWTSDLYIWNPVGGFQVLTYFDLAPFAMIVHSHILKEFCLLTSQNII